MCDVAYNKIFMPTIVMRDLVILVLIFFLLICNFIIITHTQLEIYILKVLH